MGGKRVEKGGGNAVVMADGFKEGFMWRESKESKGRPGCDSRLK